MKLKKVVVSVLLISSIAFVGCVSKEKPVNKTDEIKNEESIDNSQEAEKGEKEESSSLDYEIAKDVIEVKDKKIKIFYPQVNNYPGELLMDYMNQSLINAVEIYKNEDRYTDVEIDYKITKMDENVLSVLFEGTATVVDFGQIKIKNSVNLDMASSSNEITYENFIKSDEDSKSKVKKILDEKAKEIGIDEGLEAEGIRIYFNDENVVFYYMPLDDSAKDFVELSVPLKEIKEYTNTEFGEAPAS
ncbi:hypothetical protein R9X47_23665 [Wukongibacter baidiensis]|uniref:hypothetical protein n=1 Tax=Wukongibacter baidiensis TaxID=1723361 RepID=UPI003D7F6874